MNNNELTNATHTELVARVQELEASLSGRVRIIEMANESLLSYKKQISDTKANVEALAHEHLDLEGTEFFDGIVDLFDIELTKTVTYQYTVSIEVQATVPASMDDDEVIEELTNATLDYSFFGNGDVVIEGFDFGNMEVE